ncbi:response regulator [Tautonia sociabilis]|uniref:Response regulator n=1 Tax=Tautonia sociabilis TaxID=2080755 RepID=A0A432MPL3_9BACT|nr:response regulator [Tautonia sociabilis]RUL89352.1 response regulator [Tautonia sociabilis]
MPHEFHILLIDDSPSDVLILRRALAELPIVLRLSTLADGVSAMVHLDRLSNPSTPADQVPDLVLLDLNLPGPDGAEILSRFKSDPLLRAVPVVVLTTSGRDIDVWRSYQAGANTFVQKPADFAGYRTLAETIGRYWERTATRPPRRPPSG